MTGRTVRRNIRLYFYKQKALFHRNYRLFMAGQVLSLTGTWIQRLAMMWLSYQLTGSEFLLGMVAFTLVKGARGSVAARVQQNSREF